MAAVIFKDIARLLICYLLPIFLLLTIGVGIYKFIIKNDNKKSN